MPARHCLSRPAQNFSRSDIPSSPPYPYPSPVLPGGGILPALGPAFATAVFCTGNPSSLQTPSEHWILCPVALSHVPCSVWVCSSGAPSSLAGLCAPGGWCQLLPPSTTLGHPPPSKGRPTSSSRLHRVHVPQGAALPGTRWTPTHAQALGPTSEWHFQFIRRPIASGLVQTPAIPSFNRARRCLSLYVYIL